MGGCQEMTGMIIWSVISIGSAFLLWSIADKRGANTAFWAIMGAVFGPLAIPFVYATKPYRRKSNN